METKTYLLDNFNYFFPARMTFQVDATRKEHSNNCKLRVKFTSEMNALIESLLLVSSGFTNKTKKIGLMFLICLPYFPVILSQIARRPLGGLS